MLSLRQDNLPEKGILWNLQNSQKWKILSQLPCKEGFSLMKTESTCSSEGHRGARPWRKAGHREWGRWQTIMICPESSGLTHNDVQIATLFVHTRMKSLNRETGGSIQSTSNIAAAGGRVSVPPSWHNRHQQCHLPSSSFLHAPCSQQALGPAPPHTELQVSFRSRSQQCLPRLRASLHPSVGWPLTPLLWGG